MTFKSIHEFGALSDPLMEGKRYEAEVRRVVVEHWTSCEAEAAAGADAGAVDNTCQWRSEGMIHRCRTIHISRTASKVSCG